MMARIFFILCILLITVGCQSNEEEVELTISAAASLQDVLLDVEKQFEAENPSIQLYFNFAGSGTLQRQIEQGAPVDLFLSASEEKFNALTTKGLIKEDDGIALLANSLVLIAQKDDKSIPPLSRLSEIGQLAMGTPETVPAGRYAKEALEHFNRWESIQSQLIYTKDVRQVLTLVETKNVDAGIVYKTDAVISSKIKVIEEIPSSAHSPITYYAGIIHSTEKREAAEQFVAFMKNSISKQIFEEYGFKTLN